MPAWQTAVIAIYAVIVAVAFLRHVMLTRSLRATAFLAPDANPEPAGFVSIFVPAKDEEAGVERCLDSLLAQEGVELELFGVDDRSTDRTPEIIQQLADQDPRLKLVRITNLPPGWTGKCNALMQGQALARGDWLLFVDADTVHRPRCVATALRYAQAKDVDLLSLLPSLEAGSFWEGVLQPFAASCLMVLYPLARVNDPAQRAYAFANGQFILIRRSAYDRIGGHAGVRDKFLEDVHLARQVRNAGLNLHVAVGSDLFATRMYHSLGQSVRGWSRIFYGSLDKRAGALALLTFFILVFSVAAYAAVLGGGLLWLLGYGCPFVKTIFWLGVAHVVAQLTVFYRMYRSMNAPLRYLPLRFLAVGLMLWIIAKAAIMRVTHRVEWRGTAYGKDLQRR